jgi:hypothetical protein
MESLAGAHRHFQCDRGAQFGVRCEHAVEQAQEQTFGVRCEHPVEQTQKKTRVARKGKRWR